MSGRKPDLIVPIRDRRQRKRYLTLKNVRNAGIVALVLFAAISIHSELRGTSSSDYGRLFGRGVPAVEQKPVEVVTEAPAPPADALSADPMLVGAMQREQWLTNAGEPLEIEELGPRDVTVAAPRSDRGEGGIAIVGGPEGVEVVQQTRRRPVLTGGFGR